MKKAAKAGKLPRIVESMRAASVRLKVNLADIQRAKRAACPAFKPGNRIKISELRNWLRTNPRVVAGEPAKPATAVQPMAQGAAAALGRLEVAEREAYTRLQVAVANDPASVPEARAWWLKCGEQLRRHDLAVEASRRDAGDLIPRAECERVVAAVAATLAIHVRGVLEAVCVQLAEVSEPRGCLAILEPAAARAIESTVEALRTRPWSGAMVPDWATAVIRRAADATA